MKITLDIPEDKVSFFLELLENLNFKPMTDPYKVPEWQQNEVTKRIYAIESGEMEVEKWEDVRRELFHKK
ncbi:addiction module protein [Algoriphagus sp.]|uniref:addiction module protein n=1 Tax=Algoriphagus sp. TaxID=1872435 RepID=UPI003F6F3933